MLDLATTSLVEQNTQYADGKKPYQNEYYGVYPEFERGDNNDLSSTNDRSIVSRIFQRFVFGRRFPSRSFRGSRGVALSASAMSTSWARTTTKQYCVLGVL